MFSAKFLRYPVNSIGYERGEDVGVKQKKPEGFLLQAFHIYGSSGRTRTADKVVNSHPLYQLSYRGTNFLCSHQ